MPVLTEQICGGMASSSEKDDKKDAQQATIKAAAAELLAGFETGDIELISERTTAFLKTPAVPLDLLQLFTALSEKARLDSITEKFYERILRLNPVMPGLHRKLGLLRLANGQRGGAMRALNSALSVKASDQQARMALGSLLEELGRIDEARRHYRALTEHSPEDINGWLLYARSCRASGRHEDALAAYDQIIGIDASHADAHLEKAEVLLSLGDFENGWPEFDWRDDGRPGDRDGKPLSGPIKFNGRQVLLKQEDSIGLTLLGLRYAPVLRESGARVTLAVDRTLMPALLDSDLADDIVEPGDVDEEADITLKLLSAAGHVRSAANAQPLAGGYISPSPRVPQASADRLRVGIALRTAGSRDAEIPVARLREIITMDAPVSFFSLENSGSDDFGNISWAENRLSYPAGDTTDLRFLTDQIARMDLVIAAGGPVAHLAGAMGKPCWLILPVNADWMWGADGDRTPWYNSIRIFRQTIPGRWSRPLEKARKSLQTLAMVTVDPAAGVAPAKDKEKS
jgi:tetratricopeptide (TPR) repeat protein